MTRNTDSIRSPIENSEAQARPQIPKVNKKRKASSPAGETSVDDSTNDPGKRKPLNLQVPWILEILVLAGCIGNP